MKLVKLVLALTVLLGIAAGCENLGKNTCQTGKNLNAMFLDGYQKGLYKSR